MTMNTDETTGSATTPSTLSGSAGGPFTYTDLWASLAPQELDYEAFYKLFPLHGSASEMLDHVLDADPLSIPIGLLLLVTPAEGEHYVVPIHSVEKVRTTPGQRLCKALVGIDGDVNPVTGGTTMRRLEGLGASVFDTVQDVRVHTPTGIEKRKKLALKWSGDLLTPALETE